MPQLLQWCILHPQGESNLAAIRFAAPIRISSIRVFPNGASPFKELPDVVAKTEPDAFFLDLFFNAQPMGPSSSSESRDKDKQRPPNTLVPTTLAYAGGQIDFAIDMGTEYATRLMIVKGDYEVVSMAIYGEVVTESPPVRSYEQKALPTVDPLPLSKAIDPANASEPKRLAEKLLSIISNSVALPLVVRLMFCLKPADNDWDDPNFPHLYSDIENSDEDFDLEGVVSSVRRPIQDGISADAFTALADRVADFIGPMTNDQAYHITKLLNISASQHPDMARILLANLDMNLIFDESSVDESIILNLVHACANRDIAGHFLKNNTLFELFSSLQTNAKVDQYTQAAAKRLISRINGWKIFEDCLTNSKGDIPSAVIFLKDITTEENSVGIWVSCMLLNADLFSPLVRDDNVASEILPPPLFRNASFAVTHEEFLAFVRALVGIINVLATWAWADSLPNDMCRERTLAVLNIWQSIDGYDNIVNHLLKLRQLTRRLEWIITDSDPPRKSGIFAEQILSKLAEDPSALLQEAFIETILNLKSEPQQRLSFIGEQDRLALCKNALVAEDGLAAAVEELLFTSERPFSFRRLSTLRVSMAIIRKEVGDEDGEWRVLNKFWDGDAHGLVSRLVDLLADVADDISKHFGIQTIQQMEHTQVTQLFRTSNDLLRLIEVVSNGYPLTSRSLKSFSTAVADLFVCCDSADTSLAQTSAACAAAQAARQACLDVIHALAGPEVVTETGGLSAQVIFRALLAHASSVDGHDPVHKFLQVYSLIDHLLPYPNDDAHGTEPSYWIVSVIPKALSELKAFFKLLDTDSRLYIFRRLVRLDDGFIAIGEWLLAEELNGAIQILQDLERPHQHDDYRRILQYQLSDTFDFIFDLVKPESTLSSWYRSALSSNSDLSHLHVTLLDAILDAHYSSSAITRIAQALVTSKANTFDAELKFVILMHILRIVQLDPTIPGVIDNFLPALHDIPPESIDSERFRVEFGQALASYAHHIASLESETASILLQILRWTIVQEDKRLSTLRGLKADDFNTLCEFFGILCSDADIVTVVTDVQNRVTIDEDEIFAPPSVELQVERQLQFSLEAIQGLLQPKAEVERPSTPRAGNKTPEILGTIISPPTALLRSPAATGLTKTYMNNDFRQLRQAPSARLNTSRLPSMHVDVGVNGPSTG